jgi:hypothetical protein
VAPLPYLRVEGLLGEGNKRSRPNTVDNLACLLHQSTYISQQQPQTPAASAVWKRVDVDSTDAGSSKRRFVNAVLDAVEDEEGPRTKRRRLALTLVWDAPAAPLAAALVPKKNLILDPVSRLVQELLQSVLKGERTVSQHLEVLSTDSRFSDQTRRWLQFSGTAGNILHVSALLNDVKGALAVMAWEIPSLPEAIDADGQTPYQLAMAIGHSQVAQVLQFDIISNEEDYVYDVFLLDKEVIDNDEKDTPTCVELHGGIGYWDEHGELILEAVDDGNIEDSDNDEDDDSNREDYEGNDYLEEEDEGWDEEDGIIEEQADFRHHPVYMIGQGVQVNTKPTVESDDEEYDAQLGLYEESVPLRQYAYDPDQESD